MLNKIKKIFHSHVQCENCGARIEIELNSRNSYGETSSSSQQQPLFIDCEKCGARTNLKIIADNESSNNKMGPNNTPKMFRPGKITRNPFLNFLRAQRESSSAASILDISVEGASKWREMTPQQKCPYIAEAHHCPRRKYKRRPRKNRRMMKRK